MQWLQINVPWESEEELQCCMRFMTEIAAIQVRRYKLPHPYAVPGLHYEREPRPRERWQTPLESLRVGSADCEDLAGYLSGYLRVHGDPNALGFVKQSPGIGWHAVVSSKGLVLDPSKQLGM